MEQLKTNNEDTMVLNEEQNERSANAVRLAVDQEALFKLYAYRIVDHIGFVESTRENIDRYLGLDNEISNKYQ